MDEEEARQEELSDLRDMLRELVSEPNAGYGEATGYDYEEACGYCGQRPKWGVEPHKYVYPHTEQCPIYRGRVLLGIELIQSKDV